MERRVISDFSDGQIIYNHLVIGEPDAEEFNLHNHDVWEIIFLKYGNVSGVVGTKTYKLHKNSLIIFRPYIQHGITITGAGDYERYDIVFDENVLAPDICKKIPRGLEVINFSANRYIADLFGKLDYYYKNFKGEDYKIIIANTIEELILNLSITPDDSYNSGLRELNPIVQRALDYIDETYTQPVTVADICNNLYVTKSHLHHLFMEHLGISPKKYINTRRLTRAQRIIRMGERPSDVYTSCGFSDYATFFRNYKAYFGHTPKEEKDIEIERTINS